MEVAKLVMALQVLIAYHANKILQISTFLGHNKFVILLVIVRQEWIKMNIKALV